jgi:two-component system chemotaxis response regulator CheY
MTSVLIVDDSATLRKMIMAALRPLNLTVREAASGLEALEQLALQRVDAVTLDLNMPDMHGLEFLRFLRSHTSLKDIPVAVITTRNDTESREMLLAAGADLYIAKPFQPAELLAAIRGLFDSTRMKGGEQGQAGISSA